mmetsp:Transcript_81399/g.216031  ORF Transcript_81399/g.216031 Transcript_81399/m.216031 type:complete len:203 (+) Transcript_81399:223-831(+)
MRCRAPPEPIHPVLLRPRHAPRDGGAGRAGEAPTAGAAGGAGHQESPLPLVPQGRGPDGPRLRGERGDLLQGLLDEVGSLGLVAALRAGLQHTAAGEESGRRTAVRPGGRLLPLGLPLRARRPRPLPRAEGRAARGPRLLGLARRPAPRHPVSGRGCPAHQRRSTADAPCDRCEAGGSLWHRGLCLALEPIPLDRGLQAAAL